jgi:hypothetical protein
MQEANVPLISSVIPCIDQLVDAIDKFKDNVNNHAVVRSAAIRGLTILNKYYRKSDESYVYRIAMGWSHPTSASARITDLNLLKHWTPAINYGTSPSKGGCPVGSILSRRLRGRFMTKTI